MLTDTHTHLYSNHFNEDLSLVMQRAFDSGVKLNPLEFLSDLFLLDLAIASLINLSICL